MPLDAATRAEIALLLLLAEILTMVVVRYRNPARWVVDVLLMVGLLGAVDLAALVMLG